MTEEEYDKLLEEIVEDELATYYRAVAGVVDTSELQGLLDEN